MLTIYALSTGTMTATLTNESGIAVTGATVTLTLQYAGADVAGVAWPVTMTDASAGAYTYTVPATILTAGRTYLAKVTAVKTGVQRYAEIQVRCSIDAD
jgi:hypothetical protein